MFHDAGHLAALASVQLLTLAGLAAVTIPAGRLVVGRLETFSLEEELAFSGACGLGLLGTLLALTGLCGELRRPVAIAAAALLCVAGVAFGRQAPRRAAGRTFRPLVTIAALSLIVIFALGLNPPHLFDETLYHLPTARAFARSHHLPFLSELRFPVFPQLCETVFAGILLLAGATATHVVGLYAAALAGLALIGGGRRSGATEASWLAAAAWLGCPIVVTLAAASYVDLELTLFLLTSVLAWDIGATKRDPRWRALAALLAGFACATKDIGIPVAAGIVAASAIAAVRERSVGRLGAAVGAVGAVGAGGGLWWLRRFAFTGNPVFPYFAPLFGRTPWVTEHEATGGSIVGSKLLDLAGTARRLLATMVPSAAHRIPPFSPALLAAGILGALALRTPRGRRLVVAALVLLLLTRAYLERFLLPTFAILLAASADVLALPAGRLSRKTLALAAAVLLLPGLCAVLISSGKLFPIPSTNVEESRFLDRRLPGHEAIDFLNRRVGNDYRVLGWCDENLRDFASGDFVGDWFGLHPYRDFVSAMSDGQSLAAALERSRIDWLLYDRRRNAAALPRDPSFQKLFRLEFDDGRVALFQTVTRSP